MKKILIIATFCALTCFARAQEVTKAAAALEPKSGSKVTGTVMFTKVGDELQVVADIQNLTPGKHGFHIHEKGDCSAPDASSAGAHFNPTMKHHGGAGPPGHHPGGPGDGLDDAFGKKQLHWERKNNLNCKELVIRKTAGGEGEKKGPKNQPPPK